MVNVRKWLLILFIFPMVVQAQVKRALIIGLSDFPDTNGWEALNGANDVLLIRDLLVREQGFNNKHIETLSNEQATKKNVVEQLNKLYNNTGSGDIIYLHFSSHGQQMLDDNGDEDDGLDESIILYDASFWYEPGIYEGENHLRDDEIGVWLKKLRQKAGSQGQTIVLIDACYSGTANRVQREDDYIRGTTKIFAPEGYKPTRGKHPERSMILKKEKSLAEICVFSACREEETNHEYPIPDPKTGLRHGRLSYAFAEIIPKLKKRVSFHKLYTMLQERNEKYPCEPDGKQTFYYETSDSTTIVRLINNPKD